MKMKSKSELTKKNNSNRIIFTQLHVQVAITYCEGKPGYNEWFQPILTVLLGIPCGIWEVWLGFPLKPEFFEMFLKFLLFAIHLRGSFRFLVLLFKNYLGKDLSLE